MIDKATVQRIKDTANIVDVVSDYVHLIRRGSNYMGLCPFHNERTPSFSVNPRRNICHCFSCGKGGSPVNFLMEKESISYYDALKQLAKKYGIKVEERELTPEERKLATEREGLMIAAEAAMRQMESDLVNTDEGRNVGLTYFYGRGVTDEAIRAFHLGYALDRSNHLTGLMQRQGFDLETLKSLGLTGISQAGNYYDKYRGRVIFPIMNSSGKVTGFGGRDLKGGLAKYINSPESVLYHKNNELYGIFQAKNEIVRQSRCYLVEGYLDVISMWQSGMKNVVASSGTALTDGQIATIHRFSPNITLVYDGDAAGIKAALRGIDMLLSHNMKVNVLLLPDGHDPDSFARANTPEEFRDYVEKHSRDIIRFKINVLQKDVGDDPQKKAAVVGSVVNSIACIPDGVERTVYIAECARLMNLDEKSVAAAVERARFKVVEEQKKEKRRREAQRLYPDSQAGKQSSSVSLTPVDLNENPGEPAQNPKPSDDEKIVSDPLLRQISRGDDRGRNAMYPLESRMIELLVKYAYLDWNYHSKKLSANTDGLRSEESADESKEELDYSEEPEYYTFIDYVNDELDADNVEFSIPEFKKVFQALNDNLDDYFSSFSNKHQLLNEEFEQRRKEGHEKISREVFTMADIERAENRLERDLREDKIARLKEFARFYPGDLLASHEDREIREVTTKAISEKYILSNIFTKNGNASEEDELSMINRALFEWKSEILNQLMQKNIEELRFLSDAIDKGDSSGIALSDIALSDGSRVSVEDALKRMQLLQSKISSMMSLRSKVAKDLGDRIICARRR